MFSLLSVDPESRGIVNTVTLKLAMLLLVIGSLLLWYNTPPVADATRVSLQKQLQSTAVTEGSGSLSGDLWKLHMSAADSLLSKSDSHFSDNYDQMHLHLTGMILQLSKAGALSGTEVDDASKLLIEINAYDGLIQAARHKGYPECKPELTQADKQMRNNLIPLAAELQSNANTGNSLQLPSLSTYLILLGLMTILLIGIQGYLTIKTKRLICIPLAAATLLLVLTIAGSRMLTHTVKAAYNSNISTSASLGELTQSQATAYEACADCHFFLLRALEDPKFKQMYTDEGGHLTELSVGEAMEDRQVANALERATKSMKNWRAQLVAGTALDTPAMVQELSKHDANFLTNLENFEDNVNSTLNSEHNRLSDSTAQVNSAAADFACLPWIPFLVALLTVVGLQSKINRYGQKS